MKKDTLNPLTPAVTPRALILLTAFTVGLTSLNAQDRPPRGPGLQGPPRERVDTDGDGVISEEEKEAARQHRLEQRQAILEKFDADGDGSLSKEEREAARAAGEEKRKAAQEARFQQLDANQDGVLTPEELQAGKPEGAPAPRQGFFQRIDADDSGDISLEEFQQAVPPRGPRGPRGPQDGSRADARGDSERPHGKGPRGDRPNRRPGRE